jgi:hypothetical protein
MLGVHAYPFDGDGSLASLVRTPATPVIAIGPATTMISVTVPPELYDAFPHDVSIEGDRFPAGKNDSHGSVLPIGRYDRVRRHEVLRAEGRDSYESPYCDHRER